MKFVFVTVLAIVAISTFWYVQNGNSNVQEMAGGQSFETEVVTKDADVYVVDASDFVDGEALIVDVEESELSEEEAAGVLFMREEEKVARDVYVALYDMWGVQIFSNIAESEQTHMDAVRTLIDRYGLTDSATSEHGQFTDESLQALYDQLVLEGAVSVAEAYRIGALIEDLDIADLEMYIQGTDNVDLRQVYESLQRGSRNHLRAFNRKLVQESGESYEPEYISEELFQTIIESDTERGSQVGRRGQ